MNPEMIRGDSHTITFKSEVPLTGSEYVLTFSRSGDPDNQKYTLFSKNGTISEDGLELTFDILPEDTNDLEAGTLYFDVQFKTEDGRTASIKKQTIELVADVTRT